MPIYLESLSSMVHFPFNQVKEINLSHNCANGKSNNGADFFYNGMKFTAIHSLK